jgi:hypothetical protein
MMRWRVVLVGVTVIATIAGLAEAQIFDGGIPPTWTCDGICGASGADGVITLAPSSGAQYGYVVSAFDSPTGLALSGVGGTGSPTTGSRLRSSAFTATAGQELRFYFNYVTSDGAGYADYGWARLLDGSLTEVALLFTARTTPGGSTVPGFDMPAVAATITPATVTVVPGGPTWSPLGAESGLCYDTGCGYTDWVLSSYDIPVDGTYILEFGVVNWNDSSYQSGMAFDGITVGGAPPSASEAIPTLSGWGVLVLVSLLALLGTALIWRTRV